MVTSEVLRTPRHGSAGGVLPPGYPPRPGQGEGGPFFCGDQLPTSVMKHDGAAKVLAISGKSAGFRWFDAATC